MDAFVVTQLVQDGVTNGAIYALLALATVLVFAVTRVLFVPQGDLVALGALTFVSLQTDRVPASALLVLLLALAAAAARSAVALREGAIGRVPGEAARLLAWPLAAWALTAWAAPRALPLAADALLTVAIIAPAGPLLWQLVFRPFADAKILVLLVVAVALHFVLQGLTLVFFGAEGYRSEPFSAFLLQLGPALVSGQALVVLAATVAMIVALALFFGRSIWGKALRATAYNRVGARLVGIPGAAAGAIAFGLAATIGALSGVLVSPIATLYYDSGFLIGLKGFIAAVVGGLASFPVAAGGAVLIGLLESFASFWSSPLKEVIVFSAIVPILLWRSLRTPRSLSEGDE